MRVVVRSSHDVSAAPSSSSPAPALPRETLVHELLQQSPMGSQALPANLLQHGLLSLQGHSSYQKPAPMWAPHGVTASFGHSLLQRGVLPGLQVGICSPVGLHSCRDSLPSPWSAPWAAGNLCSGAWSTSCPPSALILGSAELFLLHILTHLLTLLLCSSFFPLLKTAIPELLGPSLMGSALASSGSVLELAGIGSVGHGRSFWQLLTEATPAASCYQNLATQTQYGNRIYLK